MAIVKENESEKKSIISDLPVKYGALSSISPSLGVNLKYLTGKYYATVLQLSYLILWVFINIQNQNRVSSQKEV